MQSTEQNVRQFVIDTFLFSIDDGGLGNTDSFIEKGLIDSMGILTLISHVEEKYGIKVEDHELVPDNWDSVERIVCFIESKRTPGVKLQESTLVS